MSISFYPTDIEGRPLQRCTCDTAPLDDERLCPACESSLNVHNARGAALRAHLDLPAADYGMIPAAELVTRCEARLAVLAPEPAGDWFDASTAERPWLPGPRPAGAMRDATARLLAVAIAAGDAWVSWS